MTAHVTRFKNQSIKVKKVTLSSLLITPNFPEWQSAKSFENVYATIIN